MTDRPDPHSGEGVADTCRPGCGACCIAPSISTAIPGMPQGKPAGVRCVQLDDDNLCRLFGDPHRPAVCVQFGFDVALCGDHREQALERIAALEIATGQESADSLRRYAPAS